MRQQPTVSIIVPNYNHERFLRDRLDSITGQTYKDYELILLDDGSTDGSVELLKKFVEGRANTSLIVNDTNSGSPFIQWIRGFNLAKGQFIWIAESDDYCSANLLECLIEPLLKDASIGISYCQSTDLIEGQKYDRLDYTKNFSPNIWEDDFTMDGQKFIESYLYLKNVIPNASAVLFRAKLLRDINLQQLQSMRFAGDWFFWLQLCILSKVHFTAKNLNYFRSHPGVTRKRHGNKIRRVGVKEEYWVRKYTEESFAVSQNKDLKRLYRNWLLRFPGVGIFNPGFYTLTYKDALHLPKYVMAKDLLISSIARWM